MNIQQVLPEAQFDSLSIGVKFYNYFDGFNRNEIQLFCYFSSLLFSYTKEPLSEWKYQFMIIDGYPFSKEINSAIELHLLNGNIEEKENYFVITTRGLKTYDEIRDLHIFLKREKSINAACSTSLMIPIREAETALLNDPEYMKQNIPNNPEWINQDYSINRIREVSEALGIPLNNLIAASSGWIKYITLINNN